jgi:hypothetical protein
MQPVKIGDKVYLTKIRGNNCEWTVRRITKFDILWGGNEVYMLANHKGEIAIVPLQDITKCPNTFRGMPSR